MEHTQTHTWGKYQGPMTEVDQYPIRDEYLYDFATPEELLLTTYEAKTVNQFVLSGGAIQMLDTSDLAAHLHIITILVGHPDPKRITWLNLQKL